MAEDTTFYGPGTSIGPTRTAAEMNAWAAGLVADRGCPYGEPTVEGPGHLWLETTSHGVRVRVEVELVEPTDLGASDAWIAEVRSVPRVAAGVAGWAARYFTERVTSPRRRAAAQR